MKNRHKLYELYWDETEECDKDSFLDVMFDFEIPEDKARETFLSLPDHIKNIAISWGLSDTVFRDEAYVYLRKKVGSNDQNV